MSRRRTQENSLQFLGGHSTSEKPLFAAARPMRDLVVLIEAEVWDRITREENPADSTLHGMLMDERIMLTRYSDDGPPDDAPRLAADEFLCGDEAVGWTVLTPSDDEMLAYTITTATTSTVSKRAILATQMLLYDMTLQAEGTSAGPSDGRLLATAHEIGADLLITDRASLLDTENEDRGNCRFVDCATALPLVALYLRASGEYILGKSARFTASASPRRFYDRAAAQSIPSLDTFVDQGEAAVGAARLLTVLRRARAIVEARDQLALHLSEPVTEETFDAVDGIFTHALVEMVGFHDVLARITNELLPHPEKNPTAVKWQKPVWRSRAIDAFPELSQPWGDGGFAIALNAALRAVRNEIHDVSPVSTPFRTRWGAPEVGLAFHEKVGTKVVEQLARLEQTSTTGIDQPFVDGHVVRPLVFLEFVLPWMFASVEATISPLLRDFPASASPTRDSSLDSEGVSRALDAIIHLRRRQTR